MTAARCHICNLPGTEAHPVREWLGRASEPPEHHSSSECFLAQRAAIETLKEAVQWAIERFPRIEQRAKYTNDLRRRCEGLLDD